jgi:hypothetical protein
MAEHPITPPPELVSEWAAESLATRHLCTQAAQWGADQELEACCEWLSVPFPSYGRELRAARRPKPPSLREQALEELDAVERLHPADYSTIRRALEQLND